MFYPTYRVRSGVVNVGSDYEILFIANVAQSLILSDEVKNFYISSSDYKFGQFDDVILEIEFMDESKKCFAIQLKHSGSERNLSIQNLISNSGNFSISKYSEVVQYGQLTDEELTQIKWIIFTNRKLYEPNELNYTIEIEHRNVNITMSPSEPEQLMEECFGRGRSYKFEVDEMSENYQTFFNSFFLYTDQLNVNQMERQLWQRFQQEFECDRSVFKEFLNFITRWSYKDGLREKLNKPWLKEVIAMCLLSPYIQPFSSVGDVNSERLNIFRQSIKFFDVTVFDDKSYEKVSRLWNVEEELVLVEDKEIANLQRQFNISAEDIRRNSDQKESSKALWLLDKCPLIVKYGPNIIRAMNLSDKRNFIILCDQNSVTNIDGLDNFLIFNNLADFDSNDFLYINLVRTLNCSLQGKSEISLEQLIQENEQMRRTVTPDQLILSLTNSFRIGEEKEDVSELYIERSISRHLIDYKIFEKDPQNTIVTVSNLSQKEFEATCERSDADKKHHQFRPFSSKLEWIRSRGGIEDVKECQIEWFMDEKDLYKEGIDNNITLFCGDPGIGKSTLIKNFKNNTFPSSWTILIYPKDHFKHFLENKHDTVKFERYILNEAKKKYKGFDFKVFEIMLNSGRVSYIWDGLDEVLESTLEIIINLIDALSKKGIKQCLTGRNNLRRQLENKFSVISRSIKQFDEEEQKRYIKKRLNCTEDELEVVFSKIKENMQFFKYQEILGIPLQIYMFTELLCGDQEDANPLSVGTFLLTDLYRHFIDKKFEVYFKEKAKSDDSNELAYLQNQKFKQERIEQYELSALKTYFSEESLEYDGRSLEKFLIELLETQKDIVGIVTRITAGSFLNFMHNSYGEYFAACYLAKNYEDIPTLSQFIFKEKYKNIRLLFDFILSKDCEAHIAVLCKNYEGLQNCPEDVLTSKDKGGRSALQLACSWGEVYPSFKTDDIQMYHAPTGEIGLQLWKKVKSYKYGDYEKREEKILEFLLQHRCDPKEKDTLHNIDACSYSDVTFGLFALGVLSKTHRISFDDLENFRNIPTVLQYSIQHNFTSIFDAMLYLASLKGQFATTKQLLEYGTRVDASNKNGNTALFAASFKGHLDIVKLLTEHGANVNSANKHGDTCLYIACEKGHVDLADHLIKYGANINVANRDGKTPLYAACSRQHLDVVDLLLKLNVNVNVVSKTGDTPLCAACENGYMDVVRLLLNYKANVNVANAKGDRPLHIAYNKGHINIVKLLVQHGANVGVVDQNGQTVLHKAASKGHLDVSEMLVEHGANVNVGDRNGNTALHKACEVGHVDLATFLIASGSTVNIINIFGETPLHKACFNGHINVVKVLIDRGADVNRHINTNGKTCLYVAYENNYLDIIKLLREHRVDVKATWYGVCGNSNVEVAKRMISDDAFDLSVDDLLFIVCMFGYNDVVKLIMQHKMKSDLDYDDKIDALVEKLIDLGANVNATYEGNKTPLRIARDTKKEAVVAVLIKHGAVEKIENEDDD